jgi:hypothetical protein
MWQVNFTELRHTQHNFNCKFSKEVLRLMPQISRHKMRCLNSIILIKEVTKIFFPAQEHRFAICKSSTKNQGPLSKKGRLTTIELRGLAPLLRLIYTHDFRVRFCIKLGHLLDHNFFVYKWTVRLNAKSDLRVNERYISNNN